VVDRLLNHIRTLDLFHPDERIILGVSGGLDSMVMAELFCRAEYKIALAHCNFCLRGDESDADELHVQKFASARNIPFYSKKFDTKFYSKEKGISIQMAARDLRLEWFGQLLSETGFDYFALAHHRDDQIETFFINLLRGTGISGIRGLLPKRGKLIHPMLFLHRKEIIDFANQIKLSYRQDSSNQKTDYLRNKIRHHLIPAIEEVKPGFATVLTKNMEHFLSVEALYKMQIAQYLEEAVKDEGEVKFVSIDFLERAPEKTTVLFEIIRPYGFSYTDADNLVNHIHSESGKVFLSSTHRIIKDRDHFIIESYWREADQDFYISESDNRLNFPVPLCFRSFDRFVGYTIPHNRSQAALDADLLKFPLVLRKWKKGDLFFPQGMKGRKLLSDFFIDRKMSLHQKENTWILVSENEIVWVVGHRIDDRYKVTAETTRVIEFVLER
jgi:tRNA(Ile)-lysidine synthase